MDFPNTTMLYSLQGSYFRGFKGFPAITVVISVMGNINDSNKSSPGTFLVCIILDSTKV